MEKLWIRNEPKDYEIGCFKKQFLKRIALLVAVEI